ncbi:MetQ/NlpA family ABC transporter substrate-binding protein [Homoserinibacter sp. YIM 151385]|uniref:MetQ/NlpA family ABC transporter substrate-binding protein n=1 Tax=Homoserinibacter sp. YIM 151385 TaxID=2985506 RepID=UPI0022F06970|nr:MetQ/NlpA family ABC transporter substrate-binding protein [Homoserinibacter sp. YIM 151385]WBU37991.1 MetQ/NlpA family ABC transporter substrate-binding protein [Homoserinibacter sp. YIM 151385]
MSDASAPIVPPKKSRGPLIAAIVIAVAAVLAIVLVVVNLAKPADAPGAEGGPELGSPENPVQIGTVGAGDPYWATFADAAEAEGISVELVDFGDYAQPNPALAEGELDLNQFQHIIYLAQYNVSSGEDLQPIGATAIYPLGLYSKQYDSAESIPDGSTVAIPDDPANLARALLVLQSAGLVELTETSPFITLDAVDEGASRVEVTTLAAAQTAIALDDVAASVINNDFIEDAGLEASDAIAQDDPSDPAALPYVNIFASRADDVDSEVLNKLVEIYQNSQEVLDGVQTASGGTAVFLTTPKADLQASLVEVEKATAEAE